ncbi:hypothetical protein F5Y19DRAFT_471523 [Xylariaceae sp. FL1651]|nr:hypothetical protein F5Y19DRAFT_471523 [Xylariaceae sp. FL1651]
MGGKVWSVAEERHFWLVAVSHSPKRAGIDLAKSEKSWERLSKEMQKAMGDEARRRYSGTMLFEHYFQNIESQRRSPNAAFFVREYLRKRDRTRHTVDVHDRVNPYSTKSISHHVGRASRPKYAASSTAANDTRIETPERATTTPPVVAARSPFGPPAIPGLDYYNTSRVLDSIEVNTKEVNHRGVSASTAVTSESSEDDSLFIEDDVDEESELEEGEIRE